MNTDDLACSMMGYRYLSGKWIKPVGYSAFLYNPNNRQWTHWFSDITGKVRLYESSIWGSTRWPESTPFIHFLKSNENYARNAFVSEGQFELAPHENDILELLVEDAPVQPTAPIPSSIKRAFKVTDL
jgi:hypothetical protein